MLHLKGRKIKRKIQNLVTRATTAADRFDVDNRPKPVKLEMAAFHEAVLQ